MPQMAPMNWLLISSFLFCSFLFTLPSIHFLTFKAPTPNKHTLSPTPLSWKW